MSILVIVESPSKCKKIEEYLGSEYKVIASFGHLTYIRTLSSINISSDFSVKYDLVKERQKQFVILQKEIENVCGRVIIATDDDREGEAIGWHICRLFDLPIETTPRIVFHEITPSAIKHAIVTHRLLNMRLIESQQSRQIMDILVGYTISPIIQNKLRKKYLSVGRCQTPALRLIYDNYLDIKMSPGKIVYKTTGYFTDKYLPFELHEKFENETKVRDFLSFCASPECHFIFTKEDIKRIKKCPPKPFNTSRLQQTASNELRMSPKETMRHAQILYEYGYITYMRTDSSNYSKEFVLLVSLYIEQNYGIEYVSNRFSNSDSDSDSDSAANVNAHEAIRPTNIKMINPTDIQDKKTIKLYELIWNRAIESCMMDLEEDVLQVRISPESIWDNNIYPIFFRKETNVVFDGFTKLQKQDKNNMYNFLNNLKNGRIICRGKIVSEMIMNDMKMHYTEARLIQLLEERGIGRPSTFASLVEKIQDRKYVEKKKTILGRKVEGKYFILEENSNIFLEEECNKEVGEEKNKLVMTSLGISVIEYLLNAPFSSLFEYGYTEEMERKLDDIVEKKIGWLDVVREQYTKINKAIEINDLEKGLKETIKIDKKNDKLCIVIDENHTLIRGKYGLVVKKTMICKGKKAKVTFISVKSELDVNELVEGHILLKDIIK